MPESKCIVAVYELPTQRKPLSVRSCGQLDQSRSMSLPPWTILWTIFVFRIRSTLFIDGSWVDDFSYVSEQADFSNTDVYDNGWYDKCTYLNKIVYFRVSSTSRKIANFSCYSLRIVWNGNSHANHATADQYDKVTLRNTTWMVRSGSKCINRDEPYATILDTKSTITTPTMGYSNRSVDGHGSNIQFHGPFQRWMLMGSESQSKQEQEIGKWVHVMRYPFCTYYPFPWFCGLEFDHFDAFNRQFHCNEDDSTFSISYQYVYCRSYDEPFQNILSINAENAPMSTCKWYGDDPNVPLNVSGYANAISFYDEMDSNLFRCVDQSNPEMDQLINSVTVSHQYPFTVNSSDSISVRISTYMAEKQFWFMIGDVSVECTGLFFNQCPFPHVDASIPIYYHQVQWRHQK